MRSGRFVGDAGFFVQNEVMRDFPVADDWSPEMVKRVNTAPLEGEVAHHDVRGKRMERVRSVLRLWRRYAPSLNLTGRGDDDALSSHVGEAVAAVVAVESALGRDLQAEDRWLDIGSGGGFPGLVIAACGGCDVVLVEPREKRAAFLEMAMGTLGFRQAVFRARLGEGGSVEALRPGGVVGLGGERGFDVVGARAVFGADEWGRRARRLSSSALVLFHLARGEALPAGYVERGRHEYRSWAAVVGA